VERPQRVHGAFFTSFDGGFGFFFLYLLLLYVDFFMKSAKVWMGIEEVE
jgi:hypothetical protein